MMVTHGDQHFLFVIIIIYCVTSVHLTIAVCKAKMLNLMCIKQDKYTVDTGFIKHDQHCDQQWIMYIHSQNSDMIVLFCDCFVFWVISFVTILIFAIYYCQWRNTLASNV